MYGAKQDTEATDVDKGACSLVRMVGKRSICDEGKPEGLLERIEVRMQA
jgi:hypothetical protein